MSVGQNGMGFGWDPILGATGGSGPGTPVNFISLTYAQAAVLIGASGLVAGSFYKITDRGDLGILLQAVSTTAFAPQGVRYMLCPSEYGTGTFDGNTWLGIWYSALNPDIDDLVIWGGMVWRSVTGNVGGYVSPIELDANWEVIPKSSSADEYTQILFGVIYDFPHDWIDKQWDGSGNVFGIDYLTEQDMLLGYNLCDISDWNMRSRSDGFGTTFTNNKLWGFFNNALATQVAGNIIPQGYIGMNVFVQSFGSNTCDNSIEGNDGTPVGGINISQNSNKGPILNNVGAGTIQSNSNNGSIESNSSGNITNNSNNGAITANGAGDITFNTNNGIISTNTVTGNITANTNDGVISNNSGAGSIETNSNLGNIIQNNCPGAIQNNKNNGHIQQNVLNAPGIILQNTNNGVITSNTVAIGIVGNSNNGTIQGNAVTGIINRNTNAGNIESHDGTINNISFNRNNGNIFENAGDPGPINITFNENNGEISGDISATDITDPEVNKP